MESVRGGRGGRSAVELGSGSAKSVPFWAVAVAVVVFVSSSEGEEFTMSVTGSVASGCGSGGGVRESLWSEGGGGEGGGEALGRTLGEITSLMQVEAGSTSWDSSTGASSVED